MDVASAPPRSRARWTLALELLLVCGALLAMRLPVLFYAGHELTDLDSGETIAGYPAYHDASQRNQRPCRVAPKETIALAPTSPAPHLHFGFLVTSTVHRGFAWLMGDASYLSLKSVALFFQVGALALWYVFLRRGFGRTTAIVFALLFACSSLFFTKHSLIVWNGLPESMLPTILSLVWLLHVWTLPPRLAWHLFGLGLFCGLSLTFSYFCAIAVGVSALAVVARARRLFPVRGVALFAVGVAAGFAPWLLHALSIGFRSTQVDGGAVLGLDASRVIENLAEMLMIRERPHMRFSEIMGPSALSLSQLPPVLREVARYLPRAVVWAGLGWLFAELLLTWRRARSAAPAPTGLPPTASLERQRARLIIAAFIAMSWGALASSSRFALTFHDPTRYVVPLVPFYLAAAALLLSALLTRSGRLRFMWRALGAALTVALLAIGIWDNFVPLRGRTSEAFRNFRAIEYGIHDMWSLDAGSAPHVNRFLDHLHQSGESLPMLLGFRTYFTEDMQTQCSTARKECMLDCPPPRHKEKLSLRNVTAHYPKEGSSPAELARDRTQYLLGAGWASAIRAGFDEGQWRHLVAELPAEWLPTLREGFALGVRSR